MTTRERDEIRSLQSTFLSILDDEHASAEDKKTASEQLFILSGALLSPLFPSGIIRNVLMIGFVALSVLAFLTPYKWLFLSFLIALSFSPRVVGELSVLSGRMRRINENCRQ